ncbi:PPE family protein, partial [Mycobacterium tuberculosis T92]
MTPCRSPVWTGHMCILLRRLCKVHPVPAIIGESFLGPLAMRAKLSGASTRHVGGCRWWIGVGAGEGEWGDGVSGV